MYYLTVHSCALVHGGNFLRYLGVVGQPLRPVYSLPQLGGLPVSATYASPYLGRRVQRVAPYVVRSFCVVHGPKCLGWARRTCITRFSLCGSWRLRARRCESRRGPVIHSVASDIWTVAMVPVRYFRLRTFFCALLRGCGVRWLDCPGQERCGSWEKHLSSVPKLPLPLFASPV